MAKLIWDEIGKRLYETGVDMVFFIDTKSQMRLLKINHIPAVFRGMA